MALKKTGVEMVAEGNASFLADVGKANSAVSDFGTTADKAASGGVSSLNKAVLSAGKVIGGLALGGAIAAIGGLSAALVTGIGDAREAAQINAQTEQTIKTMGNAAGVTSQHVQDFAASLSAANGKSLFGDSQYQESTNLLLTFQNIKGATLDLATTLTGDLAQALGGAPADQALMLGKALDNPTQGMSALTRVGLTFTEQQKAQITTMQAAGDMAGAQAIIIAALNAQVGGSAEAAAKADGGMAMFRDRMGELAESIGAQVLPLLNQFLAWLNSPEIQAAIEAIGTGLVTAVTAAATGFGSFLETMQPVVAFVKANLTPILAGLATVLIGVVVPAFVTWATAAGAAAIATIAALAPVLIPIAAIGAAVALLAKAWESDWGGMRTTLTAWWNTSVKPIFDTVKAWLGVNIPAANAVLKSTWETAWSAIKTAVTTAYSYFKDTVWPWLQTALSNIGVWIGVAQSAWSVAWTAISGAVTSAKNTISGVIETIKSLVQGAIDKVNSLISLINNIPGVNIPTIPSLPGTGRVTNKSVSPPASPIQLAQAANHNTNSTVQYNYAPTYGAAPNNPSQDFFIMQALAR